MQRALGTTILTIRPYVLVQWMTILSLLHAEYEDIEIPDLDDLAELVEQLKQEMINDSMKTTGSSDIRNERATFDDIAHVRSGTGNVDIPVHESTSANSNQMKPTHVDDTVPPLATDRPQSKPQKPEVVEIQGYHITEPHSRSREPEDNAKVLLESVCDLMDEGKVVRDKDPVNEFERGPSLIVSGFPTVFLLGRAHSEDRPSLTQSQLRHLLSQHTHNAAENTELALITFNVDEESTIIPAT